MKKWRWGIIGSGKIARRFAADLKFLKNAELIGVTSRESANLFKFCHELETTAFSFIDDLMASDVDIVYVATPHPLHKDHSINAIEAGKAVLCEKPFAMNIAETTYVLELARIKNVFIMEAMWTRFFPVIQEVVELVRSGGIGELQRIESSFGYQSEFNPDSRVFNPKLGGGSLLDVGVYGISLVRMLVEELPVRIDSEAQVCSTGVDESASWQLTFPSGVVATGESSVVKLLQNEARIIGSRGEILIPKFWCPREYFLNGVVKRLDFEGQGFQFEAEEVMRCLENGLLESPKMSHQHTRDVMTVMDQIQDIFLTQK